MTPKLFLWLLTSIAVGVVLLWLGLRGRRINRNPCCKQCGFDLSAHYPAAATCPECGAGIRLARFVVIGQRRRVWTLLALGGPLAVLPIAPIAIVLFSVLTRTDLSRFKPMGLLLWEAKSLDESAVKAAGAYLLDLQLKGGLTPAELDRVLQTAMELQSDASRPFQLEWSQILDQARVDGKLSDEHIAQIRASGAIPTYTSRPVVSAGSELPILCDAGPCRLPPTFDAELSFRLVSATINGERVSVIRSTRVSSPDFWTKSGSLPADTWKFIYSGAGSAFAQFAGGFAHQTGRFAIRVPESVGPGPHVATLTIEQTSSQAPQFSGNSNLTPPKKSKRVLTIDIPFRVESPETAAVQSLLPDDAISKELATQLIPTSAMYYDHNGSGTISVSFNIQGILTPFVYRVRLVNGDSSLLLGTITNGKGGPSLGYDYGLNQMGSRYLRASAPKGFNIKGAKLVFSPDPDYAAKTVSMTKIYTGEIVIDDPNIQTDRSDWQNNLGSPASGVIRWFFGA